MVYTSHMATNTTTKTLDQKTDAELEAELASQLDAGTPIADVSGDAVYAPSYDALLTDAAIATQTAWQNEQDGIC